METYTFWLGVHRSTSLTQSHKPVVNRLVLLLGFTDECEFPISLLLSSLVLELTRQITSSNGLKISAAINLIERLKLSKFAGCWRIACTILKPFSNELRCSD